jgi:hypothetical protein
MLQLSKGTVQKSQGALVKLLVHFILPYITMVEVETNSVPYLVNYVMIPRISNIFFYQTIDSLNIHCNKTHEN